MGRKASCCWAHTVLICIVPELCIVKTKPRKVHRIAAFALLRRHRKPAARGDHRLLALTSEEPYMAINFMGSVWQFSR